MPNANIPRGLIPVRYRSGAPYNGAANTYFVPASDGTALFIGDPVIIVTNSSDGNNIQTVTRASAGATNNITGVVVGVVSKGSRIRTAESPVYRAASTAAYVMVADDPELLFEAQEDSVGGIMSEGSGGQNVDLVAGSGSTVSGYSGFMLDSSSMGTGNTKQLRVFGPVEREDNDVSDAGGYAKWLVGINLHTSRNLTGI